MSEQKTPKKVRPRRPPKPDDERYNAGFVGKLKASHVLLDIRTPKSLRYAIAGSIVRHALVDRDVEAPRKERWNKTRVSKYQSVADGLAGFDEGDTVESLNAVEEQNNIEIFIYSVVDEGGDGISVRGVKIMPTRLPPHRNRGTSTVEPQQVYLLFVPSEQRYIAILNLRSFLVPPKTRRSLIENYHVCPRCLLRTSSLKTWQKHQSLPPH